MPSPCLNYLPRPSSLCPTTPFPARYPFPGSRPTTSVTSPWQSIHKEKLLRITISSWFLLIFIRCPALEGNEDRQDCLVLGQRETFALQLAAFSMKVITKENKKAVKRRGECGKTKKEGLHPPFPRIYEYTAIRSSSWDESFKKLISPSRCILSLSFLRLSAILGKKTPHFVNVKWRECGCTLIYFKIYLDI